MEGTYIKTEFAIALEIERNVFFNSNKTMSSAAFTEHSKPKSKQWRLFCGLWNIFYPLNPDVKRPRNSQIPLESLSSTPRLF